MDAITLATVTSALTVLGTECGKELAKDTSKDLWHKIKDMLGWRKEPAVGELASSIAFKLKENESLLQQIVLLLHEHQGDGNSASALVQKINASKVIVAHNFDVHGDLNM